MSRVFLFLDIFSRFSSLVPYNRCSLTISWSIWQHFILFTISFFPSGTPGSQSFDKVVFIGFFSFNLCFIFRPFRLSWSHHKKGLGWDLLLLHFFFHFFFIFDYYFVRHCLLFAIFIKAYYLFTYRTGEMSSNSLFT